MIRLKRNGWMQGWLDGYSMLEDRSSTEELRTTLKMKSMKQCLQNRRLQWFGYLERTSENARSSKCRTFLVSGSFTRRRLKKTWNVVNKSDPKERKVSKYLKIFHQKPPTPCKHGNHPTHASTKTIHPTQTRKTPTPCKHGKQLFKRV